jgi:hypothetical protein
MKKDFLKLGRFLHAVAVNRLSISFRHQTRLLMISGFTFLTLNIGIAQTLPSYTQPVDPTNSTTTPPALPRHRQSSSRIRLYYIKYTDGFYAGFTKERKSGGANFTFADSKALETITFPNGFVSDEDIEFNIKKEMDINTVTFTGTAILFKLCSACKTEPSKVSFLNEQEGRIYFVERECYLEPVNSDDLKKIRALER